MHNSRPSCGCYNLGKPYLYLRVALMLNAHPPMLDLSPTIFTKFEPESVGVLNNIT